VVDDCAAFFVVAGASGVASALTSTLIFPMPYLGLIKRKERWGLSARGWFFLIIAGIAMLVAAAVTVHPFLAVNEPVRGDILVVEGWLPDYALEKVIDEFRSNKYRLLVTTGGPLLKGYYLAGYKSCAGLTSETLKRLGVSEAVLATVPAPYVLRNATYASAAALKNWLLNSKLDIKAINIYSLGPHARRTRLLFQKALGDRVDVGIIAGEDRSYDPTRWWCSNAGARTVIYELIAYLYARFFV
jgi:hypothetical protein